MKYNSEKLYDLRQHMRLASCFRNDATAELEKAKAKKLYGLARKHEKLADDLQIELMGGGQ